MTAALVLGLPRLADSARSHPPPLIHGFCVKGRRYVAFPEDGRASIAMVLTLDPAAGSSIAVCGSKEPADVTARYEEIIRLFNAYDFDADETEDLNAPPDSSARPERRILR